MASRTVYVTSKTGTKYGPYTYSKGGGGGGGGAGSGKKGGKKSAKPKGAGGASKPTTITNPKVADKQMQAKGYKDASGQHTYGSRRAAQTRAKAENKKGNDAVVQQVSGVGANPTVGHAKVYVKPKGGGAVKTPATGKRLERNAKAKQKRADAKKAPVPSWAKKQEAGMKDAISSAEKYLKDNPMHHDKYGNTSKAEVRFKKEL